MRRVMPNTRHSLFIALASLASLGLFACASSATDSHAPPAPQPSGKVVSYFGGTVDPTARTMTITPRSPSDGELTTQSLPTLNYGTGTGGVYLHTAGLKATWNGTDVTATVNGVNNLANPVVDFTAVVDSFAPTGPTILAPFVGNAYNYGAIAGGGGASAAIVWDINDTGGTAFRFTGHVEGYALACATSDLSNIGAAGFTVSYTITTTQTGEAAVINQRGSCDGNDMWDMRMNNGVLGWEIDNAPTFGGAPDTSAAVNDGNPHAVVAQLKGGVATISIDGTVRSTGSSTTSLGALAPLRIGTDVCVGADGTQAFVGTISNICLSSP